MQTVGNQRKPPRKLRKAKRLAKDAEATAFGTELGKQKALKKLPNSLFFKQFLAESAKNINLIEATAIASGTYLVHEVILSTPELAGRVANLTTASIFGLAGFTFESVRQLMFPEHDVQQKLPDDWKIWVVSFFISFLLVRHAGSLIGLFKEGAGNLSALIGALLA